MVIGRECISGVFVDTVWLARVFYRGDRLEQSIFPPKQVAKSLKIQSPYRKTLASVIARCVAESKARREACQRLRYPRESSLIADFITSSLIRLLVLLHVDFVPKATAVQRGRLAFVSLNTARDPGSDSGLGAQTSFLTKARGLRTRERLVRSS